MTYTLCLRLFAAWLVTDVIPVLIPDTGPELGLKGSVMSFKINKGGILRLLW
jgi:hypothetical protein